jgi:hypothetical protein
MTAGRRLIAGAAPGGLPAAGRGVVGAIWVRDDPCG